MRSLVIDFGTATTAAVVVGDDGACSVPNPPGYAGGLRRCLEPDTPVEPVAKFLAAIRGQAQRQHGPVERAVVTVPAGLTGGDPRRSRLLAAGHAAGFAAVELLPAAIAALCSPGAPAGPELVLVYDLGATFEAALVRGRDDASDIIGHASILDWPPTGPTLELTLACCRDLLARFGLGRSDVRWVMPVGGGARTGGLDAALERSLGIAVRRLDEPELAAARGAVRWLARTGGRTIAARDTGERVMPLAFTIPGPANLLRWLVEPDQPYEEGAPLARIRLASGALWDLTARTRGSLERIIVADGGPVRSGEWLALARQA